MTEDKFEELFKSVSESTTVLKDSLQTDYHDALAENIHNILTKEVFVENGAPDTASVEKLNTLYKNINLNGLRKEDLLNLMQLSILRTEKEDKTEANKMMTPSSVAVITSLVVHELMNKMNKESFSIVDPAVGTGNLFLQLLNNIETSSNAQFTGIGIDNDDSLLSVADSYSQLVGINAEFYHQDAVDLWPVSDIDLVVSDLPVGYYPIENGLERFDTKSKNGKSFAHHLLIENSMLHLKNGGFGIFIVPSEIFETDQSEILAKWMVSNVYLQGTLSFPSNIFHSKSAQKSLVILQKHGDKAEQVKNVLMGEIPPLDNLNLFKNFELELSNWTKSNFN